MSIRSTTTGRLTMQSFCGMKAIGRQADIETGKLRSIIMITTTSQTLNMRGANGSSSSDPFPVVVLNWKEPRLYSQMLGKRWDLFLEAVTVSHLLQFNRSQFLFKENLVWFDKTQCKTWNGVTRLNYKTFYWILILVKNFRISQSYKPCLLNMLVSSPMTSLYFDNDLAANRD